MICHEYSPVSFHEHSMIRRLSWSNVAYVNHRGPLIMRSTDDGEASPQEWRHKAFSEIEWTSFLLVPAVLPDNNNARRDEKRAYISPVREHEFAEKGF